MALEWLVSAWKGLQSWAGMAEITHSQCRECVPQEGNLGRSRGKVKGCLLGEAD